jgi:hypothetical protein
MPRLNRQNIDRNTNVPNPGTTEGLTPDLILNRANQIRRDDDVIRTPNRTLYDIDYAIKWYLDNEIQPNITENQQLIPIPIIFSNGEKWNDVRRLGYIRDEKGMIQCPVIMLKRSSAVERDNLKTLDVNRIPDSNYITHKQKYNARNRYEDELFPMPTNVPAQSETVYVVDIPKYVTVEYEMMIWCNFTEQLNSVIDQILPYGRYAWGNEGNRFATAIGSITFESTNAPGEDRMIRANIPLTVQGILLSEHESRISTLKKRYSLKKVSFDVVLDVGANIFSTTIVPAQILQSSQHIFGGGSLQVVTGGTATNINALTLSYLITMRDEIAVYSNSTTVTISALAAINPTNNDAASKDEFNVYINGQYIDKAMYTWSPNGNGAQTIVFDTANMGYTIDSTDIVVVNGRWA